MIAAFYSFKGGVGRTLSVVHAALRLARGLARDEAGTVLVVDLDLEAPGLDPYLGEGHTPACGGLARLLERMRKRPPSERREWLDKALTDSRYVVTHPTLPLRYLPSGLGAVRDANGPGYTAVAGWIRELLDDAGGAALADLRAAFGSAATYTLVDSRTGLADESYLSTVLLADALVLLFRPSTLHLEGVEQVYRNFLDHRGLSPGDPRAPVIPVLSPLPNRGGTDISGFLRKEVPRVFQWRWDGETEVEARLDAPLEAVGERRLVRLYEEPAVELGETTLLTDEGRWRAGFDADTPLPRGYSRLVERLRLLNYRADWRGADRLVRAWNQRDESLAGRFLVERIRLRLGEEESITQFGLEDEVWQRTVCPVLVNLPGTQARSAVAEAGAHIVMNTKFDGDALAEAMGWCAEAPGDDTAALSVFALASRCQSGLPAKLREPLLAAIERLSVPVNAMEGVNTAAHAAVSMVWWTLGEPKRAASHLARVAPEALRAAEEARPWLLAGENVAWGLGATPFVGRIAAYGSERFHRDLLAALGWNVRAKHMAPDEPAAARLAARGTDVPMLGATPATDAGADWIVDLLVGHVPSAIPQGARSFAAARFLSALGSREGAPRTPIQVGFDRTTLAWDFGQSWALGSPALAVLPIALDSDALSFALADTFRIGTYASIRADHDTVGAAVALLERILSVAPGMGVVTRRSDGAIRPLLLAAYHLDRLGRLTDETRALFNALRAPLDADVAPPEPPLDDLAAGYVLDADRLQAAAALVGELPALVHRLHEQATRGPTPA